MAFVISLLQWTGITQMFPKCPDVIITGNDWSLVERLKVKLFKADSLMRNTSAAVGHHPTVCWQMPNLLSPEIKSMHGRPKASLRGPQPLPFRCCKKHMCGSRDNRVLVNRSCLPLWHSLFFFLRMKDMAHAGDNQ